MLKYFVLMVGNYTFSPVKKLAAIKFYLFSFVILLKF